jgi:aminomuconate-semialdehyde/2-hydroxymuconate-6-semialdehyde dehydrogenase
MTAYLLSRLCEQIGLPPGVLNIVHGTGPKVGTPLVTHHDVKAVSFTGSTASGKIIAQNAGPSMKRLALEMGGKNPNIIFADCDLERALGTTIKSSFLNQGQICLCGSRIFVEKSLYPKFREALVERTQQLVMGDPLDEKVDQGALVSEIHMKKVMSYIDLAKHEGNILTGGKRAALPGDLANGYFVLPTLVEGLPFHHKINQEEVFGPFATLTPFETVDEVVKMANSTQYGLSASVWSKDLDRAELVASRLESGTVWINTWMLRDLRVPFGGVKDSGFGREGGTEALKFFSEVKNVCIST